MLGKRSVVLALLVTFCFVAFGSSLYAADLTRIYFIDQDNGKSILKRLEEVEPDAPLAVDNGYERTLNIIASHFHVGYLKDWLNDNEVYLKIGLSTDLTKSKRLGENGLIEFSAGFKAKDDSAVNNFYARDLLRSVPFDKEAELHLQLAELDGEAARQLNSVEDSLANIIDSAKSLANLDMGNPYVQLGMAFYDLVDAKMKKNDVVWKENISMRTEGLPGLPVLKAGQWVIMSKSDKSRYQIEPETHVIFSKGMLSLKDSVKDEGKEMPTYIIVTVEVSTERAKP